MHHSDSRSMPIDEQGVEWTKVFDNMIDQQEAGCQGKPVHSEDSKLKAQLQIDAQIFQHADKISMATLILSGTI